ncbi:acyltransferase ChoActase/COT/CPT [Neoconidiobolus thromboides FSU 785]|nr:acyltransferase ChoActase/COT/CPT [Neoconidiobolus thromboides FSU 785]
MFENQESLPRLPIPELQNTINTYLKSVRQYLTPASQREVEKLAIDFIKPGGLGEELQQRLIKYDKTQRNSWLEKWWLEYAYHRYREPTLINVNWYCLGKDEENGNRPYQPDELTPFSKYQLERASRLINGMLDYKQKIDNEEFPAEYVGKKPICMNQYKDMFGVHRLPQKECDRLMKTFLKQSQHIVVLAKNHIYKVSVYEKETGNRLSNKDIQSQLLKVVKDAIDAPKSDKICLLTCAHRDLWTECYEELIKEDEQNLKELLVIHESLFVVSLDDHTTENNLNNKHKNIYHGFNGNNRWLDSALSLIIDSTGTCGLNGEHSPLDALIPASVLDFAIKSNNNYKDCNNIENIKRLNFNINQNIKTKIELAQRDITKLIADSNSIVFPFMDYGVDYIKKNAKTSPDGYIQMALQLAHYHLHGYCVSTYETGSTRKFLHGRTDAIRVYSEQSLEFCKSMKEDKFNSTERYHKLQTAVKQHLSYAAKVSEGNGIDRHLLGLRLVKKENETHSFFTHPVFAESQSWKLSTSTMLKTDLIEGTGFGSVDPNGYGINYIPAANGNKITFGIESKHSSNITDSIKFKESIDWALKQMKTMVDEANISLPKQKPRF